MVLRRRIGASLSLMSMYTCTFDVSEYRLRDLYEFVFLRFRVQPF